MSDAEAGEIQETAPTTEAEDSATETMLEGMPPEAKKMVMQTLSMQGRIGPAPHPLADKITPEHIAQIITAEEGADKRRYQNTVAARRYGFAYAVLFVLLFIFLTLFLVQADKELYSKALGVFAIFVGGFGSGYGVKAHFSRGK